MTATTETSHTPTTDGSPKSTMATIARPVLTRRSKPNARTSYVADNFVGDPDVTSGTPVLAQDGEPAGLARVTLAMRAPVELPPAPRRLIGLCSWAAAVGILGVIVAIRAVVATIIGTPTWFPFAACAVGLIGVLATMGSFVTARQQRVPWALLSVASMTLILATILTSVA